MKRLLGLLVFSMLLLSCQVRTSDNGDLDGMWQLTAIDSLQNGKSVDMHTSGEYWSVQVHLLSVENTKGRHSSMLFRFDLTGDSLRLKSPYYDESGENGKLPEHKVTGLKAFGIDQSSQSYRVVSLNSDDMVLQKNDVKLRFRKY